MSTCCTILIFLLAVSPYFLLSVHVSPEIQLPVKRGFRAQATPLNEGLHVVAERSCIVRRREGGGREGEGGGGREGRRRGSEVSKV